MDQWTHAGAITGTRSELLNEFMRQLGGRRPYRPDFTPELPYDEPQAENILFFGETAEFVYTVRFIDDSQPLA